LPILKEPRHPLSADLFSNSGVKDLNRTVVDLATDRSGAISVASGSIVKAIQEP
jgi:hypothetical protein